MPAPSPLNGLGDAAQAAGRPADALAQHSAALAIAADLAPDQQARAHHGLGHAHHSARHLAGARHHWELALGLYTNLGMPQAEQIRSQFTALEG